MYNLCFFCVNIVHVCFAVRWTKNLWNKVSKCTTGSRVQCSNNATTASKWSRWPYRPSIFSPSVNSNQATKSVADAAKQSVYRTIKKMNFILNWNSVCPTTRKAATDVLSVTRIWARAKKCGKSIWWRPAADAPKIIEKTQTILVTQCPTHITTTTISKTNKQLLIRENNF